MDSARAWLAALAGGLAVGAAIVIPVSAAAGPAPDRAAAAREPSARTVSAWMPSARGAADPVAGVLAHPRPAGRPAVVARPDFAARVAARVRCGAFTGTVQHGGDGSVLFPAFITVTGRVSSTCAATITARVGYELDFVHQGPFTLGSAGPHRTVTIRRLHRQTRVATSYQDIFVQVCAAGRRPACGAPVHV